MNRDLVSIIIPVYNGEKYLAEAIDSVLEQTYHPFEIIVIDDGSTDNSVDIARSYKEVIYIYQSHQGVAVARNNGITSAQGMFIAFQDADDIWLPNKLEVQVKYLLEHPDVEYTICRQQNFKDLGIDLSAKGTKSDLSKGKINLMDLVARKTVFEKVGSFNPDYQVGADFDWFIRAKDAGIPNIILPEFLRHRRIHDSNVSQQIQDRRTNLLRMFKESIDRQRKKRPGQ